MLTLYHGDTSVCSIKVRLTLAEKSLSWSSCLLDLQRGDQHAPAYIALNRAHVVPTLVDDGRVIVESSIIMEYLDERFPAVPLMPPEPATRAMVREWLRRVDDLHASCSTLSSAVKMAAWRASKTPAEIESYLRSVTDRAKRARQQRLIENGFQDPAVADALRAFDVFAANMEAALAESGFLAGTVCTLADLAALPYVNRAEVLGLEQLWDGSRPALAAWLDKMRARESFAEAVTKWSPAGSAMRYKQSAELSALLGRLAHP